MLTRRVILAVVVWPTVAVALSIVGIVAWIEWMTAERCDCADAETMRDGECWDCARPQSRATP